MYSISTIFYNNHSVLPQSAVAWPLTPVKNSKSVPQFDEIDFPEDSDEDEDYKPSHEEWNMTVSLGRNKIWLIVCLIYFRISLGRDKNKWGK